MSKIFNYSHLKDTLNKSALMPGELGKISGNEQIGVAVVNEVVENGQFVKLADEVKNAVVATKLEGKTVTSQDADFVPTLNGNDVYGVIIKDVHAQRFGAENAGFIYSYKDSEVSICRVGYVWVPVQDNGDVEAGAPVYLRIKADADVAEKQIGSVETDLVKVSDGQSTPTYTFYTAKLEGASFTGKVGYPLTSTQNGTATGKLTGKCALVKLELGVLA